MEPHHFLRSRRSIRRFLPQPVDEVALTRILETASHAPSAHNRQPWRFAVVASTKVKERLILEMSTEFEQDLLQDGLNPNEIGQRLKRSRERILQAPLLIILCMDLSEMDVYPESPDGKRNQAERTMAVQSCAAAGALLQLAAHAEGLDSVWTCGPLFAPTAVRKALSLPEEWIPQAMYFIGRRAEAPKNKAIRPLAETTKFVD